MNEIVKRILDSIVLLWRLLKANFQIIYGIWKISALPKPRVSIFGGHLIKMDSPYTRLAHQLGYKLSQANISVMTGGGHGIMEAANCGASHYDPRKIKARSVGINVKGLEEGFEQSLCIQEKIMTDYFFARKWLLIQYADAFIFFPGGFGTLDEFGEVMTLIQIEKLPHIQVILIGKDYWASFIKWLTEVALKKEALILDQDMELITVTDDIDEAFEIIKKHYSRMLSDPTKAHEKKERQ